MKRQKVKVLILMLTLFLGLVSCTDKVAKDSSGNGTEQKQEKQNSEKQENIAVDSPFLKMIPNYDNPQGTFALSPNGEKAVSAETVKITEEQYKKIK